MDTQCIFWAKERIWEVSKKLADATPYSQNVDTAIRLLQQAYSELEKAVINQSASQQTHE